MDLLTVTEQGLYCSAGEFYIDPVRPVPVAVITHGHADHARWGSELYVTHKLNRGIIASRLGQDCSVQLVEYGERLLRNGVSVSFHPAGHIPGSAQIRVEYKGEVWVVSGDYKLEDDGISTPWEAVPCHTFISESTFALPVFRWESQAAVAVQINDWWKQNAGQGGTSLLLGYALGKAQRLLSMIDTSIAPVFVHGAVYGMNQVLQQAGVTIPAVQKLSGDVVRAQLPKGSLVIAPPAVFGSSWERRLNVSEVGFASGWMAVRGIRRRKGVDRGFVLSDHVDWPSLVKAVFATGAERVLFTHGYTEQAARYFTEQGLNGRSL